MQVSKLKTIITITTFIFITLSLAAYGSEELSGWLWFQDCGNLKIALDVSQDGTTIYKNTFRICKLPRESLINNKDTKKILEFTFSPKRDITWEGCSDENKTTKTNEEIDGSIYLASTRENGLLLGIIIGADKRILSNTVHAVFPNRKETTEIEPGLIVSTTPFKE